MRTLLEKNKLFKSLTTEEGIQSSNQAFLKADKNDNPRHVSCQSINIENR